METRAIHIKISKVFHDYLKARAVKEHRSVTAVVTMLIEEDFNKNKGEKTK